MFWAFFSGLIVGLLGTVGLLIWQLMRSDGWDDSNVLNAVRFLHHCLRHSEDFGKMWYVKPGLNAKLEPDMVPDRRPFWYLDKDEIAEVVDTRPR